MDKIKEIEERLGQRYYRTYSDSGETYDNSNYPTPRFREYFALDLEQAFVDISYLLSHVKGLDDALKRKQICNVCWNNLEPNGGCLTCRMEKRIMELEDIYSKVINERCPADEKHCSCVPWLRMRIRELMERIHILMGFVPPDWEVRFPGGVISKVKRLIEDQK